MKALEKQTQLQQEQCANMMAFLQGSMTAKPPQEVHPPNPQPPARFKLTQPAQDLISLEEDQESTLVEEDVEDGEETKVNLLEQFYTG